MTDASTSPRPKVPKVLDRMAAWSWRLIVIGVVVLAVLWVLRQARVVFVPIVVALFLTRILSPVAAWLRRHRWRPGIAAVTSLAALLILLAGVIALAGWSVAREAESIGPTLTQAIDDIEDWLVDDSPFEVSRAAVDRFRERIAAEADRLLTSSDGAVADQATLVAETITGTLLAVLLTFFMLRDGRRLSDWIAGRARGDRPERMRRSLDAAWATLAAYLRGAVLLGVVEAITIGVTLWLVGGGLLAPVVIVTFLGAFVPVIGAVLAGVVAVLVALVTAGTGGAIIVAIVAIIVQQIDNDLLAPVIYGRALSLHPAVILLSVVAGGALFGIAGTILAVPVVAVATKSIAAYTATDHGSSPAGAPQA